MEADYVFHLGDCQNDIELFAKELKSKLVCVKGNCDGGGEERVIFIDGVKVLLTHGDRYSVKTTPYKLLLRAREMGAKVAFYGHTHLAKIEEDDEVMLVNPGAFSGYGEKSYCYAVFYNGMVTVKIVPFNK